MKKETADFEKIDEKNNERGVYIRLVTVYTHFLFYVGSFAH